MASADVTAKQFLAAAETGDESTVKRGLAQQPPIGINTTDEFGQTALHLAVRNKREAVVSLLLAPPPNAANVNARDKKTFTALHRAAEYNVGAHIIDELLTHKADVTAVATNDGFTVLHIIMRYIGPNHKYKTEAEAMEWLRFWLARGATPCLTVEYNMQHLQRRGYTPAEYAQSRGYTSVAKLLREYSSAAAATSASADTATSDSAGDASSDHKVARGALVTFSSVHCGGSSGGNDLAAFAFPVATAKHPRAVEALRVAKPPPSAQADKVTAEQFLAAAQQGDERTVQRGLAQQPPIDINTTKDMVGSTALHWAVREKREAVVSLLLAQPPPNAANVNARNNLGWTALHFAATFNAGARIIDELLAHKHTQQPKADVTVTTDDGTTVLHAIIRYGTVTYPYYKTETEAVEWLRFWLARGAAPCLIKHEGRTPTELALVGNLSVVATFLREYTPPATSDSAIASAQLLSLVCTIAEHSQLKTRIAELEAQVLELQQAAAETTASPPPPPPPISPSAPAATPAEMRALVEECDRALAEQTRQQAQLSKLQTQFDTLTAAQRQLESDKQRLESDKHQQASELGRVQRELETLRGAIARKEQELAGANKALTEKENDLKQQRRLAKERLTALSSEAALAKKESDRAMKWAQRAAEREAQARLDEIVDLNRVLAAITQQVTAHSLSAGTASSATAIPLAVSPVAVRQPVLRRAPSPVTLQTEAEVKTWAGLYRALDDVSLGPDRVNAFLGRLLTRCPKDPTLHVIVYEPQTLIRTKLMLKQWLINRADTLPFEAVAQAWCGVDVMLHIGTESGPTIANAS